MRFFNLVLFILFLGVPAFARDPALTPFEKIRSDPQLRAQLKEIITQAVVDFFDRQGGPRPLQKTDPVFRQSIPLFVTAKKGEETRGCMGSLESKEASLAEEVRNKVKLAFSLDPRHKPIRREEAPGMEVFVTAVGEPKSVDRPEYLSPARDGILIRSGGKEAVVLPGEAKTLRYLLAFAKAKAGIGKGERYQLYRIPSVTVSVTLPVDLFGKAPTEGGRAKSNPPPPTSTSPAIR
ncbi:MAG: AMMECR1 domain-containing protein [bacterium]